VDCSTFILGFAWAATVVVATWPLLLRLQLLFGRARLAVLVMTLLLFLLFIILLRCWLTAWWTVARLFVPLPAAI
jgi:predicted PurR-regulated permease PerM